MKQLKEDPIVKRKSPTPDRYILMGDVIQSRNYEPSDLRSEFLRLIYACNESMADGILSPYTVTLGDEFQGVASSLKDAVESIFYLEENSLLESLNFKLRYVIKWGRIDTPINREIAHTMMGDGLTRARHLLSDRKRGQNRFRFELSTKFQTNQLNRLFLVVNGLTERWNSDDAEYILEMISNMNNSLVGLKYDKNRTQVWKRRKNLMIEEYRALKESIFEITTWKSN